MSYVSSIEAKEAEATRLATLNSMWSAEAQFADQAEAEAAAKAFLAQVAKPISKSLRAWHEEMACHRRVWGPYMGD